MIQPIGHFRVWRALYTKPIWLNSTIEQQVILMTLMAMANFKPNEWEWKGQKFKLKEGQFITSANSIIKNTGGTVTRQSVRTALVRFEKLEFLTAESTKQGTLITLVNWRDYQYIEGQPNQRTNQSLTNDQPTGNQDLTTIEEGKKVIKKEGKEKIPLQIKNLRLKYSDIQLKIIDEYLDILSWTRKNGKIADSVILKIYTEWEKFKPDTVIYGLSIYVTNPKYHDKKENYCYGIMRNAKAEDINSLDNKPKIKVEDKNPFLNKKAGD